MARWVKYYVKSEIFHRKFMPKFDLIKNVIFFLKFSKFVVKAMIYQSQSWNVKIVQIVCWSKTLPTMIIPLFHCLKQKWTNFNCLGAIRCCWKANGAKKLSVLSCPMILVPMKRFAWIVWSEIICEFACRMWFQFNPVQTSNTEREYTFCPSTTPSRVWLGEYSNYSNSS